ncbi:hypothetical protein QOT17_014060 [Balamuthia mandrillaris]
MSVEEEEFSIPDELTSSNADKRVSGLLHVIQLATAGDRDVSVFFPLVCEMGLAKSADVRTIRLLAYQAVRLCAAPVTFVDHGWRLVYEAVLRDSMSPTEPEIRISAIKLIPFLPPTLIEEALLNFKLDFSLHLKHKEPEVRLVATNTLAELLLYNKTVRRYKKEDGKPTFAQVGWRSIAEQIFDDSPLVSAAAFDALSILFKEVSLRPGQLDLYTDSMNDYVKHELEPLAAEIVTTLLGRLRRLFFRFEYIPLEFLASAVFPLVYLVNEVGKGEDIPEIEGEPNPELLIWELVEGHILPLLHASHESLVYEAGFAIDFLASHSKNAGVSTGNWLVKVVEAFAILLSNQCTSSSIYRLVKIAVKWLHLCPWDQMLFICVNLILSVRLITDTNMRIEVLHSICNAILDADVNRRLTLQAKKQEAARPMLLDLIAIDEALNVVIWTNNDTFREDLLGCLSACCYARLNEAIESDEEGDLEAWKEQALILMEGFHEALRWETLERTYAKFNYIKLCDLGASLLRSPQQKNKSPARKAQKQRLKDLLVSKILSKLLFIKQDFTCLRCVYLICKYAATPELNKQHVYTSLKNLLRKRFLRVDAPKTRKETLRAASYAGKLGAAGTAADINPPQYLESVFSCLFLLAVRCEEKAKKEISEDVQALMRIHPKNRLLQERSQLLLKRIEHVQPLNNAEKDKGKSKIVKKSTISATAWLDFSSPIIEESETIIDNANPDNVFYLTFKRASLNMLDPDELTKLSLRLQRQFLTYSDHPGPKLGGNITNLVTKDQTNNTYLVDGEEFNETIVNTSGVIPADNPTVSSRTTVSSPNDPFEVTLAHICNFQKMRITLYVWLKNRTPMPVSNLKVLLGVTGAVKAFSRSGCRLTQVAASFPTIDAEQQVEWEVSFRVLEFTNVSFLAQVLVEEEKEMNLLYFQGGGGASGPVEMVYRTIRCLPYRISLNEFFYPLPYSLEEFNTLWNRLPSRFCCDLAFAVGLSVNDILNALSCFPFAKVLDFGFVQGNYFQLAYSGITWFGDRVCFTLTGSGLDKSQLSARFEIHTSSPSSLAAFRHALGEHWLDSLWPGRLEAAVRVMDSQRSLFNQSVAPVSRLPNIAHINDSDKEKDVIVEFPSMTVHRPTDEFVQSRWRQLKEGETAC